MSSVSAAAPPLFPGHPFCPMLLLSPPQLASGAMYPKLPVLPVMARCDTSAQVVVEEMKELGEERPAVRWERSERARELQEGGWVGAGWGWDSRSRSAVPRGLPAQLGLRQVPAGTPTASPPPPSRNPTSTAVLARYTRSGCTMCCTAPVVFVSILSSILSRPRLLSCRAALLRLDQSLRGWDSMRVLQAQRAQRTGPKLGTGGCQGAQARRQLGLG